MTKIIAQTFIDETKLQTFHDDGVVHIKNVLSNAELSAMRVVVDEEMSRHDTKHFSFQQKDAARFAGSQDMWRTNAVCKEVCTRSNLPSIAGQLLDSQKVNLFFDHLFVKYPGSPYTTSWHNDVPYWPIKGDQILSCWVALDDVVDHTGALVFALRSHKWGRFVQPDNFACKAQNFTPMELLIKTVEGVPEDTRLKSFPIKAGDALFFDAMAVHCALPNLKGKNLRRGYAVRYSGDDVVYDPRPGIHKMMLEPSLVKGSAIDCGRYPVVLRKG